MSVSRARKQHNAKPSWIYASKIVGYFFLFILLVLSYIEFRHIEYFPIKQVKIFGVQHLSHQDIQTLVTPFVDKGFFAVDVDRIKEQITQLPWVAQVTVSRIWPDQVAIAIDEKQPVALWNDTSLLSSAGELFSPEIKSYPATLPQLAGPPGEQILMAQYYSKMNSVLLPLHFKIARLELTPSMAWSITLENGMKLSIGHKDVLTRLNHFVKVYPKIVGDRVAEVEYIDLRYQNGMAVRWKTVT